MHLSFRIFPLNFIEILHTNKKSGFFIEHEKKQQFRMRKEKHLARQVNENGFLWKSGKKQINFVSK